MVILSAVIKETEGAISYLEIPASIPTDSLQEELNALWVANMYARSSTIELCTHSFIESSFSWEIK